MLKSRFAAEPRKKIKPNLLTPVTLRKVNIKQARLRLAHHKCSTLRHQMKKSAMMLVMTSKMMLVLERPANLDT